MAVHAVGGTVRIIYYSYWGTYAAYLMASLHAGVYPEKKLPSPDTIDRQYELCRRYANQAGNLIYVGLDDSLREVYSLGCRQHSGMLIRAIQNMNVVFRIREPVRFIPAKHQEGILPGILQNSHFPREERLAPYWFHAWFRRHYKVCAAAVEEAKKSLEDEETKKDLEGEKGE